MEEKSDEKHCPKVGPANSSMMDLSYEERLNIIKGEAQSLYEFCLLKNFSKKELYQCALSLNGQHKSTAKKALDDTLKPFLCLSAVIGIISIIWVQSSVQTLVNVHSRLFAIDVILPHWNWAKMYNYDCMISNPYYVPPNVSVTAQTCKYCNKSLEINHWSNVTVDSFVETCVDLGLPLVVKDTLKGHNVKPLTMPEIGYIYQNNDMLSLTMGSCRFENSVGLNESFYDFIGAYVDKKLPAKWFASWQNCQPNGAKVLRQYYKRPTFLPAMMQADPSNVIITSLGRHDDMWHKAYGDHGTGMFVIVTSGSLTYRLKPKEECLEKFGCSEKKVNVSAGEVLFYTIEWTASFTSNDDGITLAIATPVLWDNF